MSFGSMSGWSVRDCPKSARAGPSLENRVLLRCFEFSLAILLSGAVDLDFPLVDGFVSIFQFCFDPDALAPGLMSIPFFSDVLSNDLISENNNRKRSDIIKTMLLFLRGLLAFWSF